MVESSLIPHGADDPGPALMPYCCFFFFCVFVGCVLDFDHLMMMMYSDARIDLKMLRSLSQQSELCSGINSRRVSSSTVTLQLIAIL